MNDLRFAFRQLLKHPGFTAVAVLILDLGIGANTAFFSVVDQLLVRPLPVAEPQRLALLGHYSSFGLRHSFDIWHSDFVINNSCSRRLLQATDNWPQTTDN